MDREEYNRRYQLLLERLKELPQYLEEKRIKREARKKFVEDVFGDAWRKMQERKKGG